MIEIQNSYAIDYFLRILYGISKAITEHIKTGDKWTSVKKVISINIVYFDLGRGEDYIYKGTTTFSGLHQNDELQLSNAQKKMFKKEKIQDLYPEIYLLKVNNFDDVAKDTLDEWIYFLKNSEIKKNFTAKGLKEADEVLKVANMEDSERREYQRFGEVLSDRASRAMSIKIEIETAVEKRMKVIEDIFEQNMEQKVMLIKEKARIEMANKEKEIEQKAKEEKIAIVRNLLNLNSFSDKQIAELAKVSIEFVEQIKK
ncbi:MAG: PD-(D/E)XK nuclease family transposase [Chitinophagales bacterium]